MTIPVSVFNNNTANRFLQGWIDFDNNGTFNNVDVTTAGGERDTGKRDQSGTGRIAQNFCCG